jgi:hypothetical protein
MKVGFYIAEVESEDNLGGRRIMSKVFRTIGVDEDGLIYLFSTEQIPIWKSFVSSQLSKRICGEIQFQNEMLVLTFVHPRTMLSTTFVGKETEDGLVGKMNKSIENESYEPIEFTYIGKGEE